MTSSFPTLSVRKVLCTFHKPCRYGAVIQWPGAELSLYRHGELYLSRAWDSSRNSFYWETWHVSQPDAHPVFTLTHSRLKIREGITHEPIELNPAPFDWTELFDMIPYLCRRRFAPPAIDWLMERAPQPFPSLMEKLL